LHWGEQRLRAQSELSETIFAILPPRLMKSLRVLPSEMGTDYHLMTPPNRGNLRIMAGALQWFLKFQPMNPDQCLCLA
jgi:hypothetical protein